MQRSEGLCQWCREPVLAEEERYLTRQGRAVHRECMEEFLQEQWGTRRLAALAGYEYARGEDDDGGKEGVAADLVSVLPRGQRKEHLL